MMTQSEDNHRRDLLERHYTIGELAKAWHMAPSSLRIWFADEPGVIKWGERTLRKGRKQTYLSLRIPESVARRVYERKTRPRAN